MGRGGFIFPNKKYIKSVEMMCDALDIDVTFIGRQMSPSPCQHVHGSLHRTNTEKKAFLIFTRLIIALNQLFLAETEPNAGSTIP